MFQKSARSGQFPIRVLVTGFGPFPDVERNRSGDLVEAVAASFRAPGIALVTAVLPVDWSFALHESQRIIADIQPHAVLHFGVSKRATAFEIETRAFNISGPKADHAGVVRGVAPLFRSRRAIEMSTLHPAHLVSALNAQGYSAALSRDAGRYLCNALLYTTLSEARGRFPLAAFVHMPTFAANAEEPPRITFGDAVAGAAILVRTAARFVMGS